MLGIDQPSQNNQDPQQQQAEKVVAKIPKLFRVRRTPLGYLLVVVQNGSLKSSPKGIDPKLTCTVKVEGGAGDTEPMPASKQEWNTEFQFPISEYTTDVEVSLNTSRVDLVTQETRWIKEASASFPVSVSERKPWKESKIEQLQLSKGGKKKPTGTVNLSLRYVPRKNRWLPLEECILNPSAHLAKALLVLDTGLVSQQEYARSLLTLFWFNGRERELINMAVNHEIFTVFEKIDDITQLLRGPTLSSMILSEYMHIVCEPYLAEVLAPIIRPLAQSPPQFELDPTKIDSPTPDKDLKRNQKTMTSLVNKVLKKLISTANKMPPDMGYLCRLLKDAVTTRFPENPNAWTLAMGALIFLRFICPALVSPKEFGLIPNDCAPAGTRCLILVSKVLTNLVNDVEFGSKEPYMVCMNEFLVKYKTKPMEFYNNILKKKDGFLMETKAAIRAVDEDTYRKLWKVVDTAGDSLCNTLAETVPELKQIVPQIREADRIEKEEKEAREAAEAKRLQRKEKKKTKTGEKDSDKNDTGEAPATPKDPRKKGDETKKKEDTPTPKLIRKNSESVESSPLLSSSEKGDAGSGESTPREQSNTDSEDSAKSPKGKKKKLKKKTEKEETTPNTMKDSKENTSVASEGN